MIKKLIINSLTLGPFSRLGSNYYRDYVPVFMLHRMECQDLGVEGHEPSLIRESLAFLRKKKFNFVTIDDVARATVSGSSLPPNSVAFTLDDGYSDQVDIAADIFSEFDCPATYYVSTGFIDGELWYWNDKIEYIVDNCPPKKLSKLYNLYPHLNLNGKSKDQVKTIITEDATLNSLKDMEAKTSNTATRLGIELPFSAPEKYKPTTWDKLKQLEARGMGVGAHTYSHCILSRESDKTAKFEIERSTNDLKNNISRPSKVFCYPVGRVQDFGQREENYVRELGYISATSSIPGAVNTKARDEIFAIPRFSFPDTKEDFFQYATWIESFKNQLRRLNRK